MQDKFSYYDFIANIVPAIFLWWGLTLLPFIDTSRILKSQGEMEKAVVFIVLVYVFGLAIQFLAKNTIEWIVKRIFWDGKFYSEICWIEAYGKIKGESRVKLLAAICSRIGYAKDELAVLDVPSKDSEDMEKAVKLSQDIYFKVDSYTKANGLASKAHTQNCLYGLFRGLSFICLLMVIMFGFTLIARQDFRELHNWWFLAIFFLLFLFFVVRTKERGELYIKGIYYSLPV